MKRKVMKHKNARTLAPIYTAGQVLDFALLAQKYDWIQDMVGLEQDPLWHAEGDVFTHTKMVVEALQADRAWQVLPKGEQEILVLSALLHDVEKRSTTVKELVDGELRITSPRHALRGESTVRQLFYQRGDISYRNREQVAKLVRYHGLPLWAIEKQDPRKEVIAVSQLLNTKHLAMLARADVLGRRCSDQAELLLRVDLFEELCKEHHCWGKQYEFRSSAGRYAFLSGLEVAPDYEPFEREGSTMIMLCGMPGVGKDHLIHERFREWAVVSLDDLRRANKVRRGDKKGQGRVIQLAREQMRQYLRAGKDFVFNATNLTRDMRARWASLAHEYRAHVHVLYLEVPYDTLCIQNRNREFPIPQAALDKLLEKVEIPTYGEAKEVEWITK